MNSFLTRLLAILLMAYLIGMFRVWGWVLGQLFRGRAISLPRFTPKGRGTPWGLGTMALVFLVYVGVNMGVIQGYYLATGQARPASIPREPAIAKVAKKPEPIKAPPAPEKSAIEKGPIGAIPVDDQARDAAPNGPLLSVTEGMFLLTLINEILVVLIPCLVRMTSGAHLRDLGLTFSDWKDQIKIGVAGALFIAPIVYLIQFFAVRFWESNDHPVQDMVRNQFTPGVAYLAALSAVIMAPILEEMMFRGLIQSWLLKLASRQQLDRERPLNDDPFEGHTTTLPTEGHDPAETRSRRSALQAIVMTSFFFALVHYQQWPAPIPIFLLSLMLGLVYHLTGSLLTSIAMHATFNSLSTVMLFFAMSLEPKDLPRKERIPGPQPAQALVAASTSMPESSVLSTMHFEFTMKPRSNNFFSGHRARGLLEFREGVRARDTPD